jgi:hypothetical protein
MASPFSYLKLSMTRLLRSEASTSLVRSYKIADAAAWLRSDLAYRPLFFFSVLARPLRKFPRDFFDHR